MFSRPPVQFTGPEQHDNDTSSPQSNIISSEIQVCRMVEKTIPSVEYRGEYVMPGLISTRRCNTVPRLSFSSGPVAVNRTQSKKDFIKDLISSRKKTIPASVITSDRTSEVINESILNVQSTMPNFIEEEDVSPYNTLEVCSTFYPPNPRLIAAAYRGQELIKSAVKSTELTLTPIPLPEVSGIVDLNVYRQMVAIYEHNQQYLLDTNGLRQYYQQLEHWFLHIVDTPVNRRQWLLEQKFKLDNGYSTVCRIECRDLARTFSASAFLTSLLT